MFKRVTVLVATVFLIGSMQAIGQSDMGQTETRPKQILQNVVLASGIVKDASNLKPIEGARVTAGDLFAAITDSAGAFSIKVPNYKVTIRVEAEGHQAREVALKGNSSVSVLLFEADYNSFYDDVTTPLDVVPYSHLTTAATSIATQNSWNKISETPDAFLQGRVAGLNVIRRSGTANVGANLFLRGVSSLYTTNKPLIIVDGVFYDASDYGNSLISGYYNNPLSFIHLADIDNITVLKDGASLYGAKGANGVILITTARAKQEATKIDAAMYGQITAAPTNIPVLNASDYRIYLSEQLQSKGLSYSEVQALPYMNDNPNNPDYFRYHYTTNWQNKVFKNAYSQNGYVKITGGDNIAKYALSIGFLKSDGSLVNTGLNKYNTRFNADLNLSRRLTAQANLSFTYNEQTLKNTGLSFNTNPIYNALIKAPFLPANELGEKGVESPALAGVDTFKVSNPVALTNTMQATNRNYRFMGSVNFKYLLTNSLSLESTVAVTVDKIREAFFAPQRGIVSDTLANAVARNQSGAQVLRLFNIFNDTRLSFNKTYNRFHHLSASLGIRYTNSSSEIDSSRGFNSATDQLTGIGYGTASLRFIGGRLGQWAWINSYANINYDYLKKYFVSFNAAFDGSSKFGKQSYLSNSLSTPISGNTYAFFPSISWCMARIIRSVYGR